MFGKMFFDFPDKDHLNDAFCIISAIIRKDTKSEKCLRQGFREEGETSVGVDSTMGYGDYISH